MTNASLHSAVLFLTATLGFLVVGAVSAWAATNVLRARIVTWEPRARHGALVMLAALPVLSAVLLLAAVSLPAVISLAVPGFDHCHGHEDAHVHLCFTHLPAMGANVGVSIVLAIFIVYASMHGLAGTLRTRRALRVLASLSQTTEHRNDLGARVIETNRLVCFAAGLVRPEVFVSRGFLDVFGEEQRAIMLAHEIEHVRRRDAFVTSMVSALAVLHVPSVGRFIRRETEIAAEQACDEIAARAVGDRLAVAETILAVERAAAGSVPAELGSMALAFAECATERRVQSLLAEPVPPMSLRPALALVVVASITLLLASNELHHLTESALSVLVH